MGGGIRRWTRSHEEAGTQGGGTCLSRRARVLWARLARTWRCGVGRTARSSLAPRPRKKVRACTASSPCCRAAVTYVAAFRQWPARALSDAAEARRAVCRRFRAART
jgi:hypothetical protein